MPGRAGVAVVRVSGTAAFDALDRLQGARRMPPPRMAALRRLRAADGEFLDQALVIRFPAPNSFTGEDVVELHLHGGPAVVSGVLAALAAMEGLRPAEPGEFTRRAFDAGKLDLTAVEGLADLVAADTAAQRRLALRQLGGELAGLYETWTNRLTRALAWLEAAIDFADEELPDGIDLTIRADVAGVLGEMRAHLADGRRGEIVRDGFSIAIVGRPNAGKSSLLNALARREAAIVADTAGTTRDIVEVRLDVGGYAVILADTAGLRESADPVEREGVRRALARAEEADLILLLLDAGDPAAPDARTALGMLGGLAPERVLVCRNKIDIVPPALPDAGSISDSLSISAKTGDGIDSLLMRIGERVVAKVGSDETAPVLSRLRHRKAVEEAVGHLSRFERVEQADLAAEDVRLAVRCVGRITGRVDVEDLLDVIFRDFCIGK